MIALTFLLILILLNGVFAMSEIAVVSARPARLEQAADKGKPGARVALRLRQDPSRFLSTVQVGITLVGIISGAVGQAAIADQLTPFFAVIPVLAPHAESLAFALTIAIIAYFALVLGELVPKRLALLNPEAIATIVGPPMRILSIVAAPPVKILSLSTDLILTLLRAKKAEGPDITEEELHVLFQQGADAGVLHVKEHELLKNVLLLDDMRVGNIMTLRGDVHALDLEDDADTTRAKLAAADHSLMPLCDGGLDNVIGVVHVKDALHAALEGKAPNLGSLSRKALFVPRDLMALRVLEQLRKHRSHLAVVVDEHGQVNGIVTVSDVMRVIVGEMPDAQDGEAEPDFVERRDGSWLVKGQVDMHRVQERFKFDHLPGDDVGGYHTLAGFLLAIFGRMPQVADSAEWEGWRFEVVDMEGNRIDRVLVTPGDPPADPEPKTD